MALPEIGDKAPAFTVKDLQDHEAEFTKRLLKEVSLSIDLPLGLVCHDKSTAE